MLIKATIVAYVFLVQCFENVTIVAYAGLTVKVLIAVMSWLDAVVASIDVLFHGKSLICHIQTYIVVEIFTVMPYA